MNTRELVEHLNGLSITQKEGLPYDLPEGKDYAKGILDEDNAVAHELYPDKHRWYVTGVTVYKNGNDFIGCRMVTTIKSEDMGVEDVYWQYRFMEMEEVPSVNYIIKQ